MIAKDELVEAIGHALVADDDARPAALADLAGTIVFAIEANGYDATECDARVLARLSALRAAYPFAADPLPLFEPAKYSAEWLAAYVGNWRAANGRGAVTLGHHACSLCHHEVFYFFGAAGDVWWNPACNCPGSYSPPEPETWAVVADWLALQPDDAARDAILSRLT